MTRTPPHFCYQACWDTHADALDRLLNRLEWEDDDRVRADLIEEVFALCERQPHLIERARAAGIPA